MFKILNRNIEGNKEVRVIKEKNSYRIFGLINKEIKIKEDAITYEEAAILAEKIMDRLATEF